MIKLTENQIKILGRPNFACAQVAAILIAGGVYENKAKKAEYEQAVFIHWASDLLDKHGDTWLDEANKIVKQCAEEWIDKQDAQYEIAKSFLSNHPDKFLH